MSSCAAVDFRYGLDMLLKDNSSVNNELQRLRQPTNEWMNNRAVIDRISMCLPPETRLSIRILGGEDTVCWLSVIVAAV